MKYNMGVIDRLIRVLIAGIVVALYSNGMIAGTLSSVLLIIAIVFTLTSIIGFCPLYTLLGIRSNKHAA